MSCCSSLRRSGMARVNEGSDSFICHAHSYPQVEWAILPLLGWYSFPVPLRVGGWVGLDGLVKYWGDLSAGRRSPNTVLTGPFSDITCRQHLRFASCYQLFTSYLVTGVRCSVIEQHSLWLDGWPETCCLTVFVIRRVRLTVSGLTTKQYYSRPILPYTAHWRLWDYWRWH